MRYKTLRVILIWTVSIVAGIVLLLLLAQRFLGPEVKKLFVTEINKSLTAEVQVDDVELSLIKDFPFASVRFTGVRMKEALTPPSKNYLLMAGSISLRFNIWDLLQKKYKIKVIRLADVEIAPHVLADGNDNYHFWKKSSGSDNQNFNFQLQRIIIHNLHLRYSNDATAAFLDLHIPGFVAKGNFSSSRYTLDLAGNILLHKFKAQGAGQISERTINTWLVLDADNEKGLYTIKKGKLETGKLTLTAEGNILYQGEQKNVNLKVSATGSTLGEMLSLVPAEYTKTFDGYRFEGKGNVIAGISGAIADGRTPAVNVRLDMQNGTIAERKSGISLQNVSATAVYSVKQDGMNETLSISNLKAKLGDGFISGSLSMQGLSSTNMQCNLNASLNLNELQQFIKYEEFTSLSGWIKLNASFSGEIADISNPEASDFLASNLSGSGSIQQATLGLRNYGLPVKNIQSVFEFNGNDLILQQLSFALGRSDFSLKGALGNLLPWLFVKNQTLGVSGSLVAQRFDWDELSGAQKGTSDEFQFSLPVDLSVNNLELQTKNFTFGKFSATGLKGTAHMNDKVLSVNNIAMQTCQGKVTGQANINARADKFSLIQAKAHLEKVNVKLLFTQFGNFGQDDLKDENLEGLITADVVFAASMLNNLDIDLNSVKTHADVKIENGRLVNYSPMQSLSSFLKVEDLADIRFATMQNQIDISNQTIYIPAMEIKSSALDLQLMGTHTFDNELEYHFTIALADLMASKFKKRNNRVDKQSEFGEVEEDNRGRTKIYVSLTGTVDNPVVKYDKKAMREKISNDLKVQKAELKQVLKQEFNWIQGDTLKRTQQLKEKELLKKQEQGKFVIEWDEDEKVK